MGVSSFPNEDSRFSNIRRGRRGEKRFYQVRGLTLRSKVLLLEGMEDYHSRVPAIRVRTNEIYLFFWTVIRTVAVDCPTKGPKFCDLAAKFLFFWTVQYRGVFAPPAGM